MTDARVAAPAPTFADPLADAYAHDELLIGEAVALDVRPAGFILRAGGAAIDVVISVGHPHRAPARHRGSRRERPHRRGPHRDVQRLGTGAVLRRRAHDRRGGARRAGRVGKLAIGARIVRDDGGAISHPALRDPRAGRRPRDLHDPRRSIAIVTALLNGRSKRLGDLLAGTYSQHERVPVPRESCERGSGDARRRGPRSPTWPACPIALGTSRRPVPRSGPADGAGHPGTAGRRAGRRGHAVRVAHSAGASGPVPVGGRGRAPRSRVRGARAAEGGPEPPRPDPARASRTASPGADVPAALDRLSSGSGRPCTVPRPARRCRPPGRG